MKYSEFLKTKAITMMPSGFDVDADDLNKNMFDFQKDLCRWALKKGRSAILIGCGCGKTVIQLEWAMQVYKHTGKNVLILAPLSVVNQTAQEADKFRIGKVRVCRTQDDVRDGINITNYEMIDHFDVSRFSGVVLDESSILKSFSSKTTGQLTDLFAGTPYKLLCSATIAPNDYTEIGTSCEFLGIMSRTEMLATYFVHDSGKTSDWRLKKAGRKKFWEWMATWAICFNNPNELDYQIAGYDLPELHFNTILTKSEVGEYEMFVRPAETLQERRDARKESMDDRTDRAAELVSGTPEDAWLCWVDYNDESAILAKKCQGSVEVKGADDPEYKAQASLDFADGKIHCLVSKPSIFGFGSNFQSCHNMIFCGLSDSYERFYQAVRRCWRFGQEKEVNVYIILSEKEINILENIKKKQAQMDEMQREMTSLMKEVTLSEIKHTTRITDDYNPREEMRIPAWA
ncbi:MAG: helicase [Lachnospiraceae bacterium]|nr:helicase [Lachnospiraceae bacterium]